MTGISALVYGNGGLIFSDGDALISFIDVQFVRFWEIVYLSLIDLKNMHTYNYLLQKLTG